MAQKEGSFAVNIILEKSNSDKIIVPDEIDAKYEIELFIAFDSTFMLLSFLSIQSIDGQFDGRMNNLIFENNKVLQAIPAKLMKGDFHTAFFSIFNECYGICKSPEFEYFNMTELYYLSLGLFFYLIRSPKLSIIYFTIAKEIGSNIDKELNQRSTADELYLSQSKMMTGLAIAYIFLEFWLEQTE